MFDLFFSLFYKIMFSLKIATINLIYECIMKITTRSNMYYGELCKSYVIK